MKIFDPDLPSHQSNGATQEAPKIRLRIEQWLSSVIVQVTHLEPSLKGKGKLFVASNGWVIWSCLYPGIRVEDKGLFLLSDVESGALAVNCDSLEEAASVMKELDEAIIEFNLWKPPCSTLLSPSVVLTSPTTVT